jgi:hypothetical protein
LFSSNTPTLDSEPPWAVWRSDDIEYQPGQYELDCSAPEHFLERHLGLPRKAQFADEEEFGTQSKTARRSPDTVGQLHGLSSLEVGVAQHLDALLVLGRYWLVVLARWW